MDSNIIWLIVLIVIVLATNLINSKLNSKDKDDNKVTYKYWLKKHIMTQREEQFYKTLVDIFTDRWYIVPQVSLSTLLNHQVKGQNWNGAFQHINRKTVDYILLSKKDLSVVCAIELDDSTHDRDDRSKRDMEVERIFESVKLPLARFRDIDKLSKQDIVNQIAQTIKGGYTI